MHRLALIALSAAIWPHLAPAATPVNLQTCLADCAARRDQCFLSSIRPDDPVCVEPYNRCDVQCRFADGLVQGRISPDAFFDPSPEPPFRMPQP